MAQLKYWDGSAWQTAVVGAQGEQGDPGVVAASSPITYDSGTQTVGIDLSAAASDSAFTTAFAPLAPSYVTLGTDGTLSNERVLTAGSGITVTDGGAGSTLTVATDANVTMRDAAPATFFIFSPFLTASDSTAIQTQNRLLASPFFFNKATAVDRISLEITTTAASSVVRLGLYLPGSNGAPGDLYRDFGTIDSATATGVITITISETIPRGLYWICSVGQGGAPTVRARGLASAIMPQPSGGNANVLGYFVDSITGALPSTFGSTSTQQLNMPKIGFRIA